MHTYTYIYIYIYIHRERERERERERIADGLFARTFPAGRDLPRAELLVSLESIHLGYTNCGWFLCKDFPCWEGSSKG